MDQVPPGLEQALDGKSYQFFLEGGNEGWMDYPAVRQFTNAFILDEVNNKASHIYRTRASLIML